MFERVYIISLPNRKDRIAKLLKQFPNAVVVNAFRGRDLAAPKWFGAGAGAWGCYMSHIHVLMQAIHDKLENYLVLEEDAVCVPEFAENLRVFEKHVPANWGQVYLGGCHQAAPEMLNEYVYACHSVDRTHCFGVSSRAFKVMLTHLLEVERFTYLDKPRHIDHVLQQAHEKCLWSVFAPTWWFVGQCGGMSTISLEQLPGRWWHCPAYARALPLVLFGEKPTDKDMESCFFGEKAGEGFVDWRFTQAGQDAGKLVPFLIRLASEALVYNKLPAVFSKELSQPALRQLGFACVLSGDHVAELADYPRNNLINNGYYPKRKASA
jgi:GR25 family glycosyltransferase involved in LPS biosynthesis